MRRAIGCLGFVMSFELASFAFANGGCVGERPLIESLEIWGIDPNCPWCCLEDQVCIEWTVSDPVGVATVQFYLDGGEDYFYCSDGHCRSCFYRGMTLEAGTHTIRIEATSVDGAFNACESSFEEAPVDLQPPAITLNGQPCPEETIVVECHDREGVALVPLVVEVQDDLDPRPSLVCAGRGFPVGDCPNGLALLPLGENLLVIDAWDCAWNWSHHEVSIWVVDTTPPELTCPEEIVLEAISPEGALLEVDATGWAFDLCSPEIVGAFSPPLGTLLEVGVHRVRYTAADLHGNEASCEFSVRVVDAREAILSVRSSPSCGPGRVSVALSSPWPVEGFSFGLAHDPTAIAPLGCAQGAAVAALNGGRGADFWNLSLQALTEECAEETAGLTVGAVGSLESSSAGLIPPGEDLELAVVSYLPVRAGVVETEVKFVDCLRPRPRTEITFCVVAREGAESKAPRKESGFVRIEGTCFKRGDCNCDSAFDVSDPIKLLNWLFLPDPEPPCCGQACDANDDGTLDISDGIRMLDRLFLGADELPPPFRECGGDSTSGSLVCPRFPPCER
ncbi:MAG: HYR domain-containing protein [Planctomycetota bacterium]